MRIKHGEGAASTVIDRKTADRLVTGIAAGNTERLEQLYRLTRGAVYGYALSILKNAANAEDVTQDTFVRIWENAGYYAPGSGAVAWIFTITKNLSLMMLRKNNRTGELSDTEWDAIPADSPAVTPEDRIMLSEMLAALSDDERRVVLLHAGTGLKFREIAEQLQVPLSTVLSKYRRALQKLQKHWKGDAAQ